jgi:hypothetical protein
MMANLPQMGGSNAQREVVEDTLLVALLRTEQLDEARDRLATRLARRDHAWDRSLLARTRRPPTTDPPR